jgi:D-alanyl-D-alanine dipeptidase
MARAAASAQQAGLAGVLVTPGPDLLYLSGYAPVAITERITMLVVAPDREPTMIVPVLECPDAEAAPSACRLQLVDWRDGTNPTRPRPRCSIHADAMRSPTRPGRCTCSA